MFPILQIGPLAIQTPGLILLLGIWLGLSLAEHLSPRFDINPNDLYNLVLIPIVTGVISARVFYALKYMDTFIKAPINLLSLNPRLLDVQAGILIGLITFFMVVHRKQLHIWSTLDALTPLFIVIYIAFWLSQFASGNAYGIETNLPWGIYLWGTHRHPTQLYYSLSSLTVLGIVWFWIKKEKRLAGSLFLITLALLSAIFVFLEAFRATGSLLVYNTRLSQIFAYALLAFSLFMISYRRKNEGKISP